MENQKASVHPIDQMSSLQLMEALVARFGAQRTVELFGWVFIIGPLSEIAFREPGALRAELEKRGMKKSAIYRALADFRSFGEELEQGAWLPKDHTKTYQLVAKLFAVFSL